MKNLLMLLAMSILLLANQSCEKDSDGYLLEVSQNLTDDSDGDLTKAAAKRRDEFACITSNREAGIKCVSSSGKSCKKKKACTAVSSINAAQFFTEAELADFENVDLRSNRDFMLHMWEIGWFYHPDEIE